MTVNEVVNSLVTKKKKKKQKRCVGNNPLSDARKAAKGITANSKADTLWHLKCGAGYFLFLSYYAKQPSGVVAHVVADEDTSNNMICCSKEKTRVGQSRAAQRRKKKKIKIDNSSTSQNGVPSSSLTTDTSVTCGVSPIIDVSSLPCEDSLLLQTFHRMGKSISHLNSFVNALSQPLPLTFRLRNLDPTHEKKLQLQKKMVNELSSNYGHLVKPVIFDSSIYQSFFPAVCHKRKVESSLHKLLMEASSSGILARQEIGSMLPVGVLHAGGWISKNSTLLDMCASPGSKTLQAYEVTKHVVANDVHPTRMEALRCAVDRSGLSCKGLTYTQMDASTFPIPKKKFDVAIADVPCSGDGTVRKDPRTLSTWNPHIAVVLHELQVRILEQALRIVKVGGVVSYSTCSFNPIENEAVVAAVLRRFSSQQTITEVELLEWPRNAFPGLKRRSGVNNWLVADCTNSEKDMDDGTDTEDFNPVSLRWHKNYRDALTAGMDNVVKSLWPPTEDENQFFFLNRCIRLWPQDQDSGGFFVALLRKNCELD